MSPDNESTTRQTTDPVTPASEPPVVPEPVAPEPSATSVPADQPETSVPSNPETSFTPASGSGGRKMPTWVKALIIAVISLAVLGVAGFTALFFFVGNATKQAESVGSQLVSNIQSSDTASAYELTSDAFQNSTSSSQLNTLIARISPLVQGDSKVIARKITKNSGQPETATIVYSITGSKGTVYLRVVLQKNDGQWQVYNFRTSESVLSADETE